MATINTPLNPKSKPVKQPVNRQVTVQVTGQLPFYGSQTISDDDQKLSLQPGAHYNFFAASPAFSHAHSEILHEHLSDLPHASLVRAASQPALPSLYMSRFRRLYHATVHSPYLRTLPPRITGFRRKSSIDTVDTTATLSMMEMLKKDEKDGKKVGVWAAGFSIINLFLGLGLLSFPYALAEGSFLSLAVLAFTCLAMSYTGKLIVRCFKDLPWEQRTYHQVGYLALQETFSFRGRALKLGNLGMALVTFGILFEFVGGLCMNTIFIWDNISYLLPEVDRIWIVLVSSLLVLPTCWMLDTSDLALNAFLGCICKIFTVAVIMFTFLFHTSVVEEHTYEVLPESTTHFSVSIGIFILSYAGHAYLPEIYVSMKEPQKFEPLLDVCFVFMFFIYAGMAVFGYLQYGQLTSVIVTENMMDHDHETDGKQIVVAKVLVGFVIASCYFQVSPILSVVAVIPEDFMHIEGNTNKRLFRSVLFCFIVGGASLVFNHLAILEAVTGSMCTMLTSVICPALFYYGLNHKRITLRETLLLMCYIVTGIVFGFFLLYNDVLAMVKGQE